MAKKSAVVGRKSLEPKSSQGSTESRPTSKHSLARPTGEGRGEGNGGCPQDLRASVPLRQKPSALLDTRVIYCGDNLEQLAKLPDACVDLIYIDPPFNSNRNYEVFWGETKEKRAFEDRHENTKAYIDYMRPRCVQLARVLKKTGSFYYHCDWHASHYVKVILDQIFAENNFVNEIIWKRYGAHNDVGQGSKHYGRSHDVILFYNGGDEDYTWNQLFMPLDPDYVEETYRSIDEKTGKRFMTTPLTGPGGEAKGNPVFEWNRNYPLDVSKCSFDRFKAFSHYLGLCRKNFKATLTQLNHKLTKNLRRQLFCHSSFVSQPLLSVSVSCGNSTLCQCLNQHWIQHSLC